MVKPQGLLEARGAGTSAGTWEVREAAFPKESVLSERKRGRKMGRLACQLPELISSSASLFTSQAELSVYFISPPIIFHSCFRSWLTWGWEWRHRNRTRQSWAFVRGLRNYLLVSAPGPSYTCRNCLLRKMRIYQILMYNNRNVLEKLTFRVFWCLQFWN